MEQAKNNEMIQLDLFQVVQTLWSRIWLIILAMVICAAIGFSYAAFFITPTYRASTSLFVNNNTISFGGTSLTLQGDDLLSTYAVILKSRVTLEDVINDMGLDYTYEELRDMISTSSVDGTQVFQISVTGPKPYETEQIANKLAEIMPEKITDIMDGCSVRIVDYAVLPNVRIAPSISRYTGIGAFVGLLISCALILLRSMMDSAIHSEDYLKANFNIPVLTVVPDLLGSEGASYSYSYGSDYRVAPSKMKQTKPQKTAGMSSSALRKEDSSNAQKK